MSEFDEQNLEPPANRVLHAPEFLTQIDEQSRALFLGLVNQRIIHALLLENKGVPDGLYASLQYENGYLYWATGVNFPKLKVFAPKTTIAWKAIQDVMADLCLAVDLPSYDKGQLNSGVEALTSTEPQYLAHINHRAIAQRLRDALILINDHGTTRILPDLLSRQRQKAADLLGHTEPNGALKAEIVNLLAVQPNDVITHLGGFLPSYQADSLVLFDKQVPDPVKAYYHETYGVDILNKEQLCRYRVLRVKKEVPAPNSDFIFWYDNIDGTLIFKSAL